VRLLLRNLFSRANLVPLSYDSHFHCDVNFDPFVNLHETNKTFGPFLSCPTHWNAKLTSANLGFTIALRETRRTIESLWSTVKGKPVLFFRALIGLLIPTSPCRVHERASRIRRAEQRDEVPVR
jgi:hypothetical protein